MNEPTEYQVISHNGAPAFVLVPVADFERIRPLIERGRVANNIPQEVVEAHVLRDVPMVRAWREHLGMTQEQVATAAAMSQPQLAKIEGGATSPRRATLARLAAAMGITVGQLDA